MSVFGTLDLDMWFAPQQRRLFDISISKSVPSLSLYTFDLGMCFADKSVQVFDISAFKRASRKYFFPCISHVANWLCTRRFSEPNSQLSRTIHHWKMQRFATFLPFPVIELFVSSDFVLFHFFLLF